MGTSIADTITPPGWETTWFLDGIILHLLGVLIGIFNWQLPANPGDPKVKLEQLISTGLDEQYSNEMVTPLQPDGSALLFFITRSTLIDELQLLNSLSTYEGKLHKTTFCNRVVDTILVTSISERR